MLYFAYGSNLWLQQMTQRCPRSVFVGRAVLNDYRWQINERGFANVVRCPGASVHGLVYRVDDAGDQARLDRSEGVSIGAYSKAYLDVTLDPTAPILQTHSDPPLPEPQTKEPHVLEKTLVYLSEDYVRPGAPRAEYIHRINAGIKDAVSLGVPAAFFDKVVLPLMVTEVSPPGAEGTQDK